MGKIPISSFAISHLIGLKVFKEKMSVESIKSPSYQLVGGAVVFLACLMSQKGLALLVDDTVSVSIEQVLKVVDLPLQFHTLVSVSHFHAVA